MLKPTTKDILQHTTVQADIDGYLVAHYSEGMFEVEPRVILVPWRADAIGHERLMANIVMSLRGAYGPTAAGALGHGSEEWDRQEYEFYGGDERLHFTVLPRPITIKESR